MIAAYSTTAIVAGDLDCRTAARGALMMCTADLGRAAAFSAVVEKAISAQHSHSQSRSSRFSSFKSHKVTISATTTARPSSFATNIRTTKKINATSSSFVGLKVAMCHHPFHRCELHDHRRGLPPRTNDRAPENLQITGGLRQRQVFSVSML